MYFVEGSGRNETTRQIERISSVAWKKLQVQYQYQAVHSDVIQIVFENSVYHSPPPPSRVLLETLGRRVMLVFAVAKDHLVSLAVLEPTASL